MVFEYESGLRINVQTASQLGELIDELRDQESSFFILEASNGHFLQAARTGGGFVVEKQEGGLEEHFRASNADTSAEAFSTRDVKRISAAFLEGRPKEVDVIWERAGLAPGGSLPRTLDEFKDIHGDTFNARVRWFDELRGRFAVWVALVLAPFALVYLTYLIVRDLFFTF